MQKIKTFEQWGMKAPKKSRHWMKFDTRRNGIEAGRSVLLQFNINFNA